MEWKREHYRTVIFYDFKMRLDQEECLQSLQLAYVDKTPSDAIVF